MAVVVLGLGSNLGVREQILLHAYQRIEALIGKIEHKSSFYETEPWGFESEHQFLNSVICVTTHLAPIHVLKATQWIEKELGRLQKTQNLAYSDRMIDIDLLYYDCVQCNTTTLTLPHPKIQERDFVLKPLSELQDDLSLTIHSSF